MTEPGAGCCVATVAVSAPAGSVMSMPSSDNRAAASARVRPTRAGITWMASAALDGGTGTIRNLIGSRGRLTKKSASGSLRSMR